MMIQAGYKSLMNYIDDLLYLGKPNKILDSLFIPLFIATPV